MLADGHDALRRHALAAHPELPRPGPDIQRRDDEARHVAAGGHTDVDRLARGVVAEQHAGAPPHVHEVLALAADGAAAADLDAAHAAGREAVVEDAAGEDGELHARGVVLDQAHDGLAAAGVEGVVLRARGGGAFEFRGHEAADVACGGRVDEGDLRWAGDGGDYRVDAGEGVAEGVLVVVVYDDELPAAVG